MGKIFSFRLELLDNARICKDLKISRTYLFCGKVVGEKEEISDVLEALKQLEENKEKLIMSFGAKKIEELEEIPDFRLFRSGLISSHRDFDIFYQRLKAGEKSAIVSGLNPSGRLHLGHLGVFDTIIFFQQRYNVTVYVPLSDDESYVANKIENQEIGLKNSLELVKECLALGLDPKKTKFIIDQIYTNIYNFAIKLSKFINITTLRAVYNYTDSDNIGLTFYPAVQSAHILFPQLFNIKNVLVPIGLDEDTHIRVCRDVAERCGYEKPAVLHSSFLPGVDGKKMSKSKGNAIFLYEDEESIKKKVFQAFSGGRPTVEEHRRLGGNPEIDVACIYLKKLFYEKEKSDKLYEDYRAGKLLSGDVKKLLLDEILKRVRKFKENYNKITSKEMTTSILTNETTDLQAILDKTGVMDIKL